MSDRFDNKTNIVARHDPVRRVVYVNMAGPIGAEHFIAAIEAQYSQDNVRDAIWDVRKASLGGIDPAGVRRIAETALRFAAKRQGGKSVLICEDRLKNSILELYAMIGKAMNFTIPVIIVPTPEDAERAIAKA